MEEQEARSLLDLPEIDILLKKICKSLPGCNVYNLKRTCKTTRDCLAYDTTKFKRFHDAWNEFLTAFVKNSRKILELIKTANTYDYKQCFIMNKPMAILQINDFTITLEMLNERSISAIIKTPTKRYSQIANINTDGTLTQWVYDKKNPSAQGIEMKREVMNLVSTSSPVFSEADIRMSPIKISYGSDTLDKVKAAIDESVRIMSDKPGLCTKLQNAWENADTELQNAAREFNGIVKSFSQNTSSAGLGGRVNLTKRELYQIAIKIDLKGRSLMDKKQLLRALKKRKAI